MGRTMRTAGARRTSPPDVLAAADAAAKPRRTEVAAAWSVTGVLASVCSPAVKRPAPGSRIATTDTVRAITVRRVTT